LPIEMLDQNGAPAEHRNDRLLDLAPFRLQLSHEGRTHAVTTILYDMKQNEVLFGRLAELQGTNLIAFARPGATVLGTHPLLKGSDGRPLPVLTVGEAKKGRVLALTSDSTWRWGFEATSEVEAQHPYQRFWEAAMRWLIRDPALSLLRIQTDEAEYGP